MKFTILGAGLSGISCSYHLGHENCLIYEKNNYLGGHIHSEFINGFTWDEGPHVSFTKNEYVKELFESNIEGEFFEYPVSTSNYYKGNWIPHPAQSNLWAVPQPLRDKCLSDFLNSRNLTDLVPNNYNEWLNIAFGETFAKAFPFKYTKKYWTTTPKNLSTDWVGERVFSPKIDDVNKGYLQPLSFQTHYITHVRYPKRGGYFSFAKKLYAGSNINLSKELIKINLDSKEIFFSDGTCHCYDKLINTLPLPIFIEYSNAPKEVKDAAKQLNCTSVLLVNVTANHPTVRQDNWIYVYDEDKYSTRINFTELLSPNNAPINKTGIQVEVYFSNYKEKDGTNVQIANKVCEELIEMGLIESHQSIESCDTRWVQWANVIFDNQRREFQNIVFDYLKEYGLVREVDDLEPMTNWNETKKFKSGDIILAGRFAQWKYFWTDDCVLRGKQISESIK